MDTPPAPRLLDRVRDRIRVKHYSIRTEQAYVDWIKRFIRFHGKRHPTELGSAEVEAFLTHLAVAGNVAAATQNQAKSALLFMYREVLGAELPWLSGVTPAKAPRRLPVVLTRAEVARVLRCLHGTHRLIGCLLYGTGMRIMEGVRLRIKDVEFERRQIIVRDGKGAKDRMTMLPKGVVGALLRHLVRVREMHECDLVAGRRRGLVASRAGAQVSECCAGVGVAVRLSGGSPVGGPAHGRGCGGIISAIRRSSGRCARRFGMPTSTSPRRRTRCATRSRHTCSMPATTSARCRSCSGTRT